MYEVGAEVTYQGSIEHLHGQIFTVVAHCCGGERYRLQGRSEALRHVRPASVARYEKPTETLAVLERAIAAERPVMITYVAADGEWTTRTIEPFELDTTARGHLIVRAMDRLRREARTFRLDRIDSLTPYPGVFLLTAARMERDALARIRAEIAEVQAAGFGGYDGYGAMRWTPDNPIVI
ncbi:hypothetical protein C1I98_13385 [Spongiactinospora gelatinilytica]|uniref:WYL domain-containing protein n=1 Tax=Spongiactinospora gelatinilytica TaxID=2666298 RepID=A0A2W2HCZ3_9ACTN|nr:hypothetical protein C1I98_13385 [Spongiactinospora gelatinilytica]